MNLYPFQEEGVRFLMRKSPEIGFNHKLLADEQGLGKTPQAIVAALRLKAQKLLIVCPVSVKYNWARQLVNWGFCTDEQIYVVRSLTDCGFADASVVIINYDLLASATIRQLLSTFKFDIGIFDEAHRLKSKDAARSHYVLGQKGVANYCRRRWCLTGTPVPNRPIEIFWLLRTLARKTIAPFDSWVKFGRRFCSGFRDKNGERDPESGQKWNFKGASNVAELRERLKPFMLRRELKEVYKELPQMFEETVYLKVSLDNHPEIIQQRENTQVCRTGEFDPSQEMPLATIRRIIAECKVNAAHEYIEDALKTIDKLVVFTYHRNVTERLVALCKRFNPVALYGGVDAENKQKYVDKFIRDDSTRLFIGQITASGEGIDGLQRVCSHVIFAEIDWSAGGMLQAKSRLHRIGQLKPVQVQYLIADNTIETIMAKVLENKENVISRLLQTDKVHLEREPMTIEQHLAALTAAVEANTAALLGSGGSASKPSAKPATVEVEADDDAEAPKAKPAKKPAKKGASLEDLQKAAKAYVSTPGATKKACKELVRKYAGVDSLADVPEEKIEILVKKLNEAAAELAEDTTSDDDDIDLD